MLDTKLWWGQRIRALRKSQRLTQSELARLVDIPTFSQGTVSQIEKGDCYPSLPAAIELARIFGVPLEVLFSEPVQLVQVEAA